VFTYSLQLCDTKNKLTCSLECDFHYWQLYMGLTLVLCMVLCLFQKELERARMEQACVTSEKQNLERQLLQQESDQTELHTSYSDLEVARLKAEIEACIRDSGACIWLEFQIQNYIFDRYVQLFISSNVYWVQVTLFWWFMYLVQLSKHLILSVTILI